MKDNMIMIAVFMYVQSAAFTLGKFFNQMPLSISRRSRIEAAPPDTQKEIVAALE